MKNWKVWLHSLIAAAVSGVGTGMTGWAVGLTPLQMKALITVNVMISVGAFLKTSPLPQD